ncbi:bromodomain-containing protein 4-like [Anopheles marshallii]|uniref:bromodomain-containing protein 4-like n=1 Tax=Anopheles marshallii TaxID=1521116 RepID=UPI00237B3F02|nr:bromodomain-containing protein 4-like [Anopheles marshallii]
MSKSYEPQIKWRVNEVKELVASMKERELLTISDGKKVRSLEVFSVVRNDLQRNGIFRTEEQIRKKMNELRKQYFEANRSESENRYELCEHYDVLHDLFTDAQRKLDKRTERSRARSKRRHSQNGADVLDSVQSNISISNRRSVSGSSVCSSAHSSKHNGYEQHHTDHTPQPQQKQQNGGETIQNGGGRNHSKERMVPDKIHLKQISYQPNLNNFLTNLCKNDRYADVMLLVCNDDDSIAIPAHRLVLATFSPYFANVFEKFTLVPSSPIIYVALPPTVTRAAMQSLLQYMYTGEAIVQRDVFDDVLMGGEFLRINGFSAKKSSSTVKNNQGLVSVPLVTVSKTINMDSSVQRDARPESTTPAPATVTTRDSPPTPVSMMIRPYYDSQSPPRKMARHYEPMQQQAQQTLFQQPEYSLTHQSKRDMQQMQQHNLHRSMYQGELFDHQPMQQAQPSPMLSQRQVQFIHQRQVQQYQSQQMSDDLFQPMPTLRQQQHLMMQPLQPTMLQQRQVQPQYHPQQLQPLDMDMEQDLLQPPLHTMQMQRQRQQQLMPTQQRSLQSQSHLQDDIYGPQLLPLSRQAQPLLQFVQTQESPQPQQQGPTQLKQQNMPLLQQPQRQMVQMPQFSSQQQRLRSQPQQLENDYQSEQQLQDDLQLPEQLVESQELLDPQQPRQRQPTTQLQQSQQPVQQKLLQQRSSQPQPRKPQQLQLQEGQLPESAELLESQKLLQPQKSPQQPQRTLRQQPQMQDDLMEPQELLESQELLAPPKSRQIQHQRQPQQLQRMLQQRVTQQQKMQDEVIKPQELLETQELLEPQKPRQTLQELEPLQQQQQRASQQSKQQQVQRSKPQQQQLQPKSQIKERPVQQQKTQIKETVHNSVCKPEPVAKSSKDGIPPPMLDDSLPENVDDSSEATNEATKEGGSEIPNDKSLDDSVTTRSDSEIDFLEKPRKNSIFGEFPDHRKFEDHEQRKKDFIKEYEEHMKNSQHPLVETPESSPSVPPVSPKSPVVARYRSKSPLPSTVTMQQRKPCSQRRAPSPKPDIIEALDSMVTLTSDESMMEIITKSPESQTSHFSTRSHSPDSQAKINALIEVMGMPDSDTAIFVNSSMDEQSCADLDDDSIDHQEGTPLDQLVSSRLNCQLCYESFTTPPEWVQHVSGHCIVDQGLLKRRRISSDDDSDNDSNYFRCDMCSSYFILAQDWQNHVANHETEAHADV